MWIPIIPLYSLAKKHRTATLLEDIFGDSVVKNPPANARVAGSIPGQERPLEEEMANHSSILAWETPWTEECGRNSAWSHEESDMI